MNNKLEVIGIDHGWSMMKTISQVFVTGVKEITTTQALFGDVLEYEGKFYKVGTVRQEVKDTKVEDDSFYLLTLAAVAKELKRRGLAEAMVFLAVCLLYTSNYHPEIENGDSNGDNETGIIGALGNKLEKTFKNSLSVMKSEHAEKVLSLIHI